MAVGSILELTIYYSPVAEDYSHTLSSRRSSVRRGIGAGHHFSRYAM